MVPKNTTNLSVAGYFKWIALIASIGPVFKAFQGLVLRETATGMPSRSTVPGSVVIADDAIREGLLSLLVAATFWAIAWALWFFFQRHEE